MNNKELVNYIKGIRFKIIHERGGITFHPLACPALFKIFSTGIEKVVPGGSYDPMVLLFYNGKTIVLMPDEKCKSTGLKALSMLKKDPKIIKKYIIQLKKKSRKFLGYMKKISKNFDKASDKKLLKYYKEYVKQYFDCCLLGEPFPFAVRHELTRYLEELLKSKIKNKKKVLDYFTTLVSPVELSFINREEMMLNRIIKKIKDNKRYTNLFNKKTKFILKNLNKFPELNKLIQKHQHNFFWVPHDYVGEIWTIKDIIDKIKASLKEKKKILLREEDYTKELKLKQNKLFQELKKKKVINKNQKELFIAAQDATILFDLKKEKLSEAHYYINHMFKVIGRRRKIDFWDVIFLLETEFKDFLDGKIDKNELKSRRKKSTYVCKNYNIYCLGAEDTEIIAKYYLDHAGKNLMEISGICASSGNIIARVKVLKSPKEIGKIKKGEILVAGMTTPEYVPAMKKSAAIITDEGGVTCHAAIVSRELGIPCIVGTKIATKVLKDNMLVEIHAGTGAVKILRR